jgi:hypothetical protein
MTGKMAAQATVFEHGKSATSQMILTLAAQSKGCQCEAYVDWFTYKLWKDQGYQVQRGEKSVKLTVYKKYEYETDDGKIKTGSRPWNSSVFCRCQVQAR